ncbi:ABC transporter substrate-binding protein [Haloferax profundi]|uniref:ABC transporter substrate-binding protein n=1 Tax=Haloferax profundi TaxID=1544718 RepID=A0A0W1SL51_9EURY|nr:ABC transporter substrate-binding protein [Haloferax profundi]KTG26902.1 ABC transporter substrate-binding protein [Haloferax profundi]
MSTSRLSRRSLLALTGVGLTSGCIRQLESTFSRDHQQQLSFSIKTVPADADAVATKVARYLATQLQRVGISASVVPVSREELLRSVLLNHDFDVYVYRFPLPWDPDFLRPLLHSRYAPDVGWQNPFGYGDLSLDSLLERQQAERGVVRTSTLTDAQHRIVENQPFTPVAIPHTARATRPDRVDWPVDEPIHSVAAYLGARPVETRRFPSRVPPTAAVGNVTANESTQTTPTTTDTTTDAPQPANRLRMTITDARPTENLNPLSTPFRSDGTFIRLVYDSLGRVLDDEMHPWMAASWDWLDDDSSTLAVRLRDDLEWHDGNAITAADVAFTFRFLADTSLGSLDQLVPSPEYRGRASLVDSVSAASSREVHLSFGDVDETVALRALSVPILPEHVWEPYARPTSVSWLDGGRVTEALVRNNLEPVGSGPFRVTGTSFRESLSLEPFDAHFLATQTLDESLARFEGGFAFDGLEFIVAPSGGSAIKLLSSGVVDATAGLLSSDAVKSALATPDISVRTGVSRWCYHVGYNLRKPPFTNPRFRRAVARLVARPYLTESVFDGRAYGVMSPLATTEFSPTGESWTTVLEELRFVGNHQTGSLDTSSARSMFEDAGYTYSKSGELLVQR